MSVLRSYYQWTPPILIKHYTAADNVLSMESIVVWSKTISKFVRQTDITRQSHSIIVHRDFELIVCYRETWKPWDPWLNLSIFITIFKVHRVVNTYIVLLTPQLVLWTSRIFCEGRGRKKHIFHALCLTPDSLVPIPFFAREACAHAYYERK